METYINGGVMSQYSRFPIFDQHLANTNVSEMVHGNDMHT